MSAITEVKIDLEEDFPHLQAAPIVEAVIDIRARPDRSWEEESVRSEAEAKLPGYVFLDSQRAIERELRVEAGRPPEQTLRDLGWKGLRFKSADERHICQFNRDGFVFSWLRPYESWARLQSEGLRLWEIYSAVARPTQAQRLGLRFINRIVLPPQDLRFEDYIQPAAQPPKLLDVPFHGFLHHDTLAVPGHPYAINVVRTIQTAPDQPLGIILDIDVFTLKAFEAQPGVLHAHLSAMRWLKNKVFFGSITSKALERFE